MDISHQTAFLSAQLAAIYAETVFWGIHLTTCIWAIKLMLKPLSSHRSDGKTVNWPQVIGAALLFSVGTVNISATFTQGVQAFVRSSTSAEAAEYFRNLTDPLSILKDVILTVQFILADCMLIHRCYIVYSQSVWVILPSVTITLAMLATGLRAVAFFGSIGRDSSATIRGASQVVPWTRAFIALSLANSLLLTSLILYRIWLAHRTTIDIYSGGQIIDQSPRSPYLSAARVIVESYLLYTVIGAIGLALYITENNAYWAISMALIHIVGINFDLVYIRVHQGKAFDPSTSRSSNRRGIASTSFRVRRPGTNTPCPTILSFESPGNGARFSGRPESGNVSSLKAARQSDEVMEIA